MKRSALWNLTVASALVGTLAACGQENLAEVTSGQAATPLGATAAVPALADSAAFGHLGGAHILPMQYPGTSPLSEAPLAGNLKYYGGHVLASVKIVPVYWGTGTAQVPSEMRGFYTAVVNHPYMDWLSEYDTNIKAVDGSTGTNQHIGRGTVDAKDYTITPSITAKSITDIDIQTELNHQLDTSKLPAPDANTIYMIHFPLGIHISLGGAGSCSTFCAYHSTLTKSGQSVYYSVLPYLGTGSGCEGGCGRAAHLLGNHTSVASHELIEAVTDGEIGLVTGSIGKPAAWYDSVGGEIGDICNANQGTLSGTVSPTGDPYVVQKEWSNQAKACIVEKSSDTTAPTVKVTSPSAGTTLTGSVTLTATATDPDDAVAKVDFYAGTKLVGTATAAPFQITWSSATVSNGTYSITAKGTDSHGNVGTSAGVSVSVTNMGMPDTTPPVVRVTAPGTFASLKGSVTLTATATDPDDAVSKVDFYLGTTLIATATTAPYSVKGDSTKVKNGFYFLTAKGTDSHGNVGTSAGVLVIVGN